MTSPSREKHAEILADLATDLRDFKTELVVALNKPTQTADHAIHADTLEGKTPAEIQALAMAEVTKHTSKLGQNIHGLDPTALGTYNKQQFDASFDLMLDTDNGVPMDFYGDREFLPPAVTGSFESGSTTTPYNYVAMMMEDNGTLMILRSATDGDSAGVYYSYLRNAMTETDFDNNLLMSNVEYRPAYFPAGMRAKAILNGSQDIIVGIMKDAATGAHTGYFISLTNNTMDMTKHTGIFVPNGNFLDVRGPFPGLYQVPFGFIRGNYVYILHDLHQENKLGHRVWRIAKNDLITGVFKGATQIKGWTINRGSAGTVVRDDIVFFDDQASSSLVSGKPMTCVWQVNGSTGATPLTRDNGTTGIMFSYYVQYYPTDNQAQVPGVEWFFRYEFDETTKQINAAKYHDRKANANYSGTQITSGDAACTPMTVTSHRNSNNGQSTASIYSNVFNQLWQWVSVSYLSQGFRTLARYSYPDNLDPVAVMAGEYNYQGAPVGNSPVGKFGSALTASFRAVGNIGDNVLTCMNYGRPDPTQTSTWYYVRSALVGEPTFQYDSMTGNFAFKGFAPTADRTVIKNTAVEYILNEASPGVSKVSQARFSRWWPDEVTRAANVDTNINASGTITVPKAVMDSLETQILNNLASRGLTKGASFDGHNFSFELVIPQVYTDMAPFVIGSIVTDDANRAHYMYVYNVTIGGSRQAVSSASIQPGTGLIMKHEVTANIALGVWPLREAGQMAIRRVNGGFAVGYAGPTYFEVVGNGGRAMMHFKVSSSGVWTMSGSIFWDYHGGTAPSGWVNLPSRGLFYVLSSEFIYGEIDAGTKMIAALADANDYQNYSVGDLMNNARSPAYGFIMASQRVVSAWTVYFADETPAMLDGFYSPVQPLSYSLNPATDGNKTFYVWLVRTGNALTYAITTSNQPPASPSLYLGRFTTNSTGLNLIDVRKRVAVGGKMLSPDARGSSIPLTSGTPNSYGRLNWN